MSNELSRLASARCSGTCYVAPLAMSQHITFNERFASVTETVRMLAVDGSGVSDDARGQLATILAYLEVSTRFGDRASILRRAEALLGWTWSVRLDPCTPSLGSATRLLRNTPHPRG